MFKKLALVSFMALLLVLGLGSTSFAAEKDSTDNQIQSTPTLRISDTTPSVGQNIRFTITHSLSGTLSATVYKGDGNTIRLRYATGNPIVIGTEETRYTKAGTYTASAMLIKSDGTAYLTNSVRVTVR